MPYFEPETIGAPFMVPLKLLLVIQNWPKQVNPYHAYSGKLFLVELVLVEVQVPLIRKFLIFPVV